MQCFTVRQQAPHCLFLHCTIFLQAENLKIPAGFLPLVDEKIPCLHTFGERLFKSIYLSLPLSQGNFVFHKLHIFSTAFLSGQSFSCIKTAICIKQLLEAPCFPFCLTLSCQGGEEGSCLWMGTWAQQLLILLCMPNTTGSVRLLIARLQVADAFDWFSFLINNKPNQTKWVNLGDILFIPDKPFLRQLNLNILWDT